ncbi:carbohydrate ABC transporter permease [Haloprofundus halobius]|uniref:carbohydrate ABC transporter permease n=1 Tax=Haloprofundus halobius TaxID=2876194 RepID=UPI001CCAFD1E|nr:carbohydrate ABC transporter permease [Haloprofundus halobius]
MATDERPGQPTVDGAKNDVAEYLKNLNGFNVLRGGLIVLISVLWLIPLLALLYIAVQPSLPQGAFWSLPESIALISNLGEAWSDGNFGNYAINSLIYASVGAVIAVFLASLAGFTIAQLDIPYRDGILFLILLFTFFPFQMYLIPLVKVANMTGLYNTKTGVSIIYITIAIPFAAFVLRNYFITIPNSLYEAARIDGLSKFQIYWKIYLPLAKPALAVALIFQWIWIWNEFLFGLVLTSSPDARPMATALALLGGRSADWTVLAAGTLLTVGPPLVVFLLFQKHFVRGLLAGTQKG